MGSIPLRSTYKNLEKSSVYAGLRGSYFFKKRGDYLKKAYYHLMKIEQKKNKIFGVENYGEINAELNRKFAKGEYFDSSEVYVEDGYLCVGEGFFRLSGKEQDALIEYLCPEDDSTEE